MVDVSIARIFICKSLIHQCRFFKRSARIVYVKKGRGGIGADLAAEGGYLAGPLKANRE
jgi:hypothetical protein